MSWNPWTLFFVFGDGEKKADKKASSQDGEEEEGEMGRGRKKRTSVCGREWERGRESVGDGAVRCVRGCGSVRVCVGSGRGGLGGCGGGGRRR